MRLFYKNLGFTWALKQGQVPKRRPLCLIQRVTSWRYPYPLPFRRHLSARGSSAWRITDLAASCLGLCSFTPKTLSSFQQTICIP